MSFDAADFLGGLFRGPGDSGKPGPKQEPQAVGAGPDEPERQLTEEARTRKHHPAVILMSQLVCAGFTLRLSGEAFEVAPRDLLTAAQRRAIDKYRQQLIWLCREIDAADRLFSHRDSEADSPRA